jgi:hypothetical protein
LCSRVSHHQRTHRHQHEHGQPEWPFLDALDANALPATIAVAIAIAKAGSLTTNTAATAAAATTAPATTTAAAATTATAATTIAAGASNAAPIKPAAGGSSNHSKSNESVSLGQLQVLTCHQVSSQSILVMKEQQICTKKYTAKDMCVN